MASKSRVNVWSVVFVVGLLVVAAVGIAAALNKPVRQGTSYFAGITAAGPVMVDGQSNVGQLTVQGFTTQTAALIVAETSAGTDKFTVDASGNIIAEGSSNLKGSVYDSGGTFTIGDNTDVTGTLQYGASNLYPVGNATSGYAFKAGKSAQITGTVAYTSATTGMGTSITAAGCSVYDTAVTGNEPSSCLVYWSGTTVTFTAVMSTGAASTTGAYLTWWVFGQP